MVKKDSAMDWYEQETARIADVAWRAYMGGDFTPLYLWGKLGELRVAQGNLTHEGFSLVCAEMLPRNLDKAGMVSWVRSRTRRFPCLPVGS